MTQTPNDSARVLVTPEDLLGYEIDGRYRLDAILGGGGMGVVYRTTQQNLNRNIAIKLLKLEDSGDGRRIERFRREIDIIAQLTHPNIVRVFDSGQDSKLGLHYIAMELVDGAPLDDVMRGHRLTSELAIDVAYEVCAALTEPHRLGIVHRDIKPANVLLAPRSDDTLSVKVVDFGIARGVSGKEGQSRITTTGVVVGSPMYMAPEVARGESLDARTDLYSLGVLIYEMVTGDTPFRGSTPVAIMLRHAVDEPPSLADAVDDDFRIPELVELVDRMLSKERRSRPEDAKAVLRTLEEIRKAYQLGRVRLDGSKPLIASLEEQRIPVERAALDGEKDADPYSPTTPFEQTDAEPPMHSDSFSGWLVSESARSAITSDGTVREPEDADDSLGELQARRSSPAVAIIAAVVAAALVGGIAFFMIGPDEAPGDEQPTITAPADAEEQVQLGEPVEAAAPVAVTPDLGTLQVDAGQAADAAGSVDSGPPSAEKPQPKPAAKNPRKKPEDGTNDEELDEGMQWLQEK